MSYRYLYCSSLILQLHSSIIPLLSQISCSSLITHPLLLVILSCSLSIFLAYLLSLILHSSFSVINHPCLSLVIPSHLISFILYHSSSYFISHPLSLIITHYSFFVFGVCPWLLSIITCPYPCPLLSPLMSTSYFQLSTQSHLVRCA